MSTSQIKINIPLSFQQIVEIVKQLSPSEKKRLKEVIFNDKSIEAEEITEDQKQAVRNRINKYKNSPESYLSWNDIEQKMTSGK